MSHKLGRIFSISFLLGMTAVALLSACGGGAPSAPAAQPLAASPAPQASAAAQATDTLAPSATPVPSQTTRPTVTPKPTTTARPTTTPKPSSTPRSTAPATSQSQVSPAGLNWHQAGAGANVQLQSVSCPSAGLCLAAGAESTLLKSTDGGATWSPKHVDVQASVISQVYCQNESKCLALVTDPLLGTGGIYESSDAGGTWAQTTSWDDAGGVIDRVSCIGSGTCYGIGENGIFKKAASDPHWHLVDDRVFPAPPPARFLVDIACPSEQLCVALGQPRVDQEGIILTATNGGVTASRVTNLDQDLQGLNFTAVTCLTDTSCLAAGSNGVIIKSEDGGGTWTRQSWTPPSSEGPLELRSINCPSDSTCFAVGGNVITGKCCGVIIKSVDEGKTWTNEKLDLPFLLWSLSCNSETNCVAVGDSGLIVNLSTGPVALLPTATSPTTSGDIISNATMAGGVKGFGMPTGVTDTFPPEWKEIHTVVTTSEAPSETRVKIVWTAVDVGSAASPNSKIGDYSGTVEGSTSYDYYFSPSGALAEGTYKVDLYVNDNLDRTLNFYVRKGASAPAVNTTPSPVGSCPPAPTHTSQSSIVESVTMAKDTDATSKAPVDPTNTFSPKDKFHAAVKVVNAPDNTKFKAIWFATDVGDAAPCNFQITAPFEATYSGSTNLDFTLNRDVGFPVGLYRVEIYVDDQFAMEADFSVQ